MSTHVPRPKSPILAQPMHGNGPHRLIVTASVVTFAVRDWSLWVLLRDGPWGPPMRLVLGSESVSDAVERILEAVLLWPSQASLLQLKAGWQEQQVCVWGSTEQGSAVSLFHSMLLRANRDELRPNLHAQAVPTLRVKWVPVADVEARRWAIDADVWPGFLNALYTLRSQIQRDPEIVLRYLADMSTMRPLPMELDWWRATDTSGNKETRPLGVVKEPAVGDSTLTLAEAMLLYRAFFPQDEPIDPSYLRRRFLATNRLQALNEARPVRGRERDRRCVSRVYRYPG